MLSDKRSVLDTLHRTLEETERRLAKVPDDGPTIELKRLLQLWLWIASLENPSGAGDKSHAAPASKAYL